MLDCAQYASIADMSSCCTCGSVRGHPKLSSFSQEYTEYAGGGGRVNGLCTLFQNVDIYALQICIKNQYFKSTLLGGRSLKNKYYVYAFDNVDNNYCGRPLNCQVYLHSVCLSSGHSWPPTQ